MKKSTLYRLLKSASLDYREHVHAAAEIKKRLNLDPVPGALEAHHTTLESLARDYKAAGGLRDVSKFL